MLSIRTDRVWKTIRGRKRCGLNGKRTGRQFERRSMLRDKSEAYELLSVLGAPDRLVRHAELVDEAAGRILSEFQRLGVSCDARVVRFGAVLHDAGKIRHSRELSEPGSLHEQAGEALLLAHGVQPEIARCCSSHAAWDLPGVSLEERTVSLADKLWKGKGEAA